MSPKTQTAMRHNVLAALVMLVGLLASSSALAGVDEGDRPQLEAKSLSGDEIDLEALRGKVVLVDFWATWCKPCVKSFPFYSKLVDTYGDRGFMVVGVSVDRDRSLVERFVDAHQVSFPVVVDTDHALTRRFGPTTMPTAYLIARSGKVVEVHAGFTDEDRAKIEGWITKLLGGTGTEPDAEN